MSSAFIEDLRSEDTYIFIEINSSSYAIGTKSILEIVKLVQMDCPERLPRHIAGIVEYNSIMINIVDLRSVLNMPMRPYTLDNQVIIIATDEMIFGLVVDEVIDIRKIDRRFLQSAPYHTEHTYAQAIYTENSEYNTTLLSIDAIESSLKEALEDIHSISECTELMPRDYSSAEVLKQRAMQLSRKDHAASSYMLLKEKDQYMSFYVGKTCYCIKLEHIKSFTKIQQQKVTRVPCVPPFIAGLLNVKGDCISLIDIKAYLNSSKTSIDENSVIIILNSGEFKLGFVVDQIGNNINIPEEELNKIRTDSKAELTDYVFEDQLYYILNIPQMLNNEKLYIR